MTHEELCDRARRWLSGTRRCNPVFYRNASCSEIPDAIGWSSVRLWSGSTVIECKTSRSDFAADLRKRVIYRHPENWWTYKPSRISRKAAERMGYKPEEVSAMGDFRFYFCEPGILTPELIEKKAPGHGLLCAEGRFVRMLRQAPRRTNVDYHSEIRYLRFAIINAKRPFTPLPNSLITQTNI